MTDERSFLTNQCQTLEGVDHSRNRQSKAHSFCFSRKLNPTSVVWESKRQVASPNTHFRFALAGTNTIGIVCALCKKNCEKGSFSCCHFRRNEAAIVGSAAFFMNSVPCELAHECAPSISAGAHTNDTAGETCSETKF